MPSTEVWKDIPGFEGLYQASNDGNIRSRKTGHYRKLTKKHNDRTGYDFVILHKDGKGYSRTIHRLVALSHIPNPGGLTCVNHKDEVKTNNNVENLEWCTFQYNSEYSKHKKQKQVEVYTLDGELLGCFVSETAAAAVLGTGKANVSQALNSDSRSCCGFAVKFKED